MADPDTKTTNVRTFNFLNSEDLKGRTKIKINVNPEEFFNSPLKYIKENLDVNSIKLFNEYNYGSYLLFEGIPVFIDSRADLYAPEFNGVKGKDGKYEGQDIFSDYINTSNISKYYENTFNTIYINCNLKVLSSFGFLFCRLILIIIII